MRGKEKETGTERDEGSRHRKPRGAKLREPLPTLWHVLSFFWDLTKDSPPVLLEASRISLSTVRVNGPTYEEGR